jgi:1,2-diacylglycerol 3-alpha-glucosyltransferase
MNIAIFTDCYLPIKNGVVTSVLQLKIGLEKKGHEVIIITSEVPLYEDKDNNVFRLPSVKAGLGTEQRFSFFNQGAINRFLKRKNIQIIHTHTEFSLGFGGRWAAKKLKIPHVHTLHTMWEEYKHYILNGRLLSVKMIRKILKSYLKNINALIAPSIKAKKYFKTLLPTIPCQIIHNGIDMQKFKSSKITKNEIIQLRKEFDLKKNDKLIIFVGRIGKEKRVKELLNSVTPVLKKNSNVKMIFVGEGPELKELVRLTTELHLTKQIVFTGFVNWELVYRLYTIADIFTTASLSEVHPMTLIEASMCGLAIIARKDDSYLDLVQNDINGYLVDTDKEISLKLKEVLNNKEKLKRFSEASLYISQSYTAENHVIKVENFYKKILELYPDRMHLLSENE